MAIPTAIFLSCKLQCVKKMYRNYTNIEVQAMTDLFHSNKDCRAIIASSNDSTTRAAGASDIGLLAVSKAPAAYFGSMNLSPKQLCAQVNYAQCKVTYK